MNTNLRIRYRFFALINNFSVKLDRLIHRL